ncbi:MAG: xylulokinase [Actinomycetota bacterium]|jgi:xylulokinase
MPLVAGVDSSTSACKVEIRDADTGELVASGRAAHPATTPPRSEQHPAAWAEAFDVAWAQAGADGPNRPAALAIAGQQHGLVVCDRQGRPLRAAKLWNDTESADDAAALLERCSPAEWANACGGVPVPSFTITKLRWLRRTEPEVFDRIERVMLPHDWLTHRLTGSVTTDRGDASGTGWFSPADDRYRTDLLQLVDPDVDWAPRLPIVLGPTDAAGDWNGIMVAAGTGDNMAAALGLGLRPGDMCISLGTSGTAFAVSDAPSSDPTGIVAGFADASGRYLPLVCTLNATKVTDALARLLGTDVEGLGRLAEHQPHDTARVTVVPYLDGERTPNLPDATGSILGLRSDVSREELARAAFDGVVCNLLDGADRLGAGTGRRFLVGGGSRSTTYRRTVATLTGTAVLVPDEQELVARGAALQAAAALTGVALDEVALAWTLDVHEVAPDPAVDHRSVRARYSQAAQRAARH